MSNSVALANIAIELTTALIRVYQTQQLAAAQGREVSDDEVKTAGDDAKSAIARLEAAKPSTV